MSKLSRSHSTYIERAENILKFLQTIDEISKISLGIIKVKNPSGKTHGKFKITITKSHILLEVNSKSSNQEIRIFGQDLENISKTIIKELKKEKQEYIVPKQLS